MKRVELYGRVRHAVMIEGLSQREAARCFGIDPRTVRKMLSYSVPPGYVRTRPPVRPKLDPFIGIIDRILEEDKDRPKKQRHTSKRIFERLRDEYGFTGKITIVKDYIRGVRQRRREMFVPLTHPPAPAGSMFVPLTHPPGRCAALDQTTPRLPRILGDGASGTRVYQRVTIEQPLWKFGTPLISSSEVL